MKVQITPELSKQVGWAPRIVDWPINAEMIETASEFDILIWYRFLPPAETESQREMIKVICGRINPNSSALR